PRYQCCGLGWDQTMTCQLSLEAARAEPHRPPISAWLELEGSPNHQVTRFHIVAPSKAQMMMSEVMATNLESTRPEEIVWATAVPHIAPRRLVTGASTTAWRGFRNLVQTTVALVLAVS